MVVQIYREKVKKVRSTEKGEKRNSEMVPYRAGESGWFEEVSVLVEGGLSSLLLPE